MPRKRNRRGKKEEKDQEYDSDDSADYGSKSAPDPKSSEYYHDAVDEFNLKKNMISLEGGSDGSSSDNDEEEVLGLDESDSDDDLAEKMRMLKRNKHLEEMASDLEDEGEEGEDKEMPDAKAWGQKKQDFFDTDYVDDDIPGVSGSEEEAAREEEEREALAIQQRMAETMEEDDFGLDLFKPKTISKVQEKLPEDEEEEQMTLDLSKLSKREKLQILKKESPEFLELVDDFKVKMREVIDKLQPLHNMVKDGRIPDGPGAAYVKTKYQLCLGYCINISFYMVLKARHTPVHNHPIVGRILEYRKLLNELEPIDVKFADEIQQLLTQKDDTKVEKAKMTQKKKSSTATKRKALSQSHEGYHGDKEDEKTEELRPKKKAKKKKSKETKNVSGLTAEEQKALEYYEAMASKMQQKRREKDKELGLLQEEDGDEEEPEGPQDEEGIEKRGISYKISKNKGLTARKRKELRNPRVKHRMKFKKAKVRRKGQVREVRTELQRYGGELSGIRAGVIKSVKIK